MVKVNELMNDKEKWYGDAIDFWQKQDPTVDGMLQGFEKISDIDVKGSALFLKSLQNEKILTAPCRRAADCGAGIGRVSKQFLLNHFDVEDIIEQCPNFTANIHAYIDDDKLSSKIENIYTIGLQEFTPKDAHYDVIWIQWVIGHLTDDDMVEFLQRCKKGLTEGGCIVIKDNTCEVKITVFDEDDSSVTRHNSLFLKLFERAGMTVLKNEVQKGFPTSIFPVRMYAIR